jgi:hypothetical protein
MANQGFIIRNIVRILVAHSGPLTSGAICAQLRAEGSDLSEIAHRTIHCACREAARQGRILHTAKPSSKVRYADLFSAPPPDRYRARQILDTWTVERLHPHIAGHWTTIGTMTEDEARTCVAALNELDRKVRARRQGEE